MCVSKWFSVWQNVLLCSKQFFFVAKYVAFYMPKYLSFFFRIAAIELQYWLAGVLQSCLLRIVISWSKMVHWVAELLLILLYIQYMEEWHHAAGM
jgi:hypothetical protein